MSKRSNRGKRWFYACGQQDRAAGWPYPRRNSLTGFALHAYRAGFFGWAAP